MAFDSLSDKLQNIFKNLRGKGRLSEADVKAAKEEAAKAQKLVDALKDSKGKDALQARIDGLNKKIKAAEETLAATEKQKAYDKYVAEITTALKNVKFEDAKNEDVRVENIKKAVKADLDKVTAPAGASYEIKDVDSTNKVTVKVKSTESVVTLAADVVETVTAK